MVDRLPPSTFDIPAAEIRRGYRSAIYFNRAKKIAAANPELDQLPHTMQVFQKKDAVLCGIDEAIAILKIGTGYWSDEGKAHLFFDEYMRQKLLARGAGWQERLHAMRRLVELEGDLDELWVSTFDELEVHALYDGNVIKPWEPVMHITGDYSSFAHLESVYLGVLARRTKVATNTRAVVNAANDKPVLFFADRFDHWATQGGDGYSAHIGGATGMASDAMAAWWGEYGVGTMPHALIAFFDRGGHENHRRAALIDACTAFREHYPDANLIALVDYNNDCIRDALAVLAEFGKDLWGVRLDTSENMMDKWLVDFPYLGDFKPTGVNPVLVKQMRKELDSNRGEHVRIVVSGGFNPTKITEFERERVPVDIYAVGSSLLAGQYDFTADIVSPHGKAGRRLRISGRLENVI